MKNPVQAGLQMFTFHIIETDKKSCERSDSGYISANGEVTEIDWERFYDMFSDDFFLPPKEYEYVFGSFTIEEIQDVDDYIEDLYLSRFGIDESGLSDGFIEDFVVHTSVMSDSIAENDMRTEENWEDEFTDETFTMPKPVKVVPIGMTMDNLNGEKFMTFDPLLKHFETFDTSCGPKGGIPEPAGKVARNHRKKLKFRNKKSGATDQLLLDHSGQGRTFARSADGQVFNLL